jgi:hypothetical protein
MGNKYRLIFRFSYILLLLAYVPYILFLCLYLSGIPLYVSIPSLFTYVVAAMACMMLDSSKEFWSSLEDLNDKREKLAQESKDHKLWIAALKRVCLRKAGITKEEIDKEVKYLQKNETDY